MARPLLLIRTRWAGARGTCHTGRTVSVRCWVSWHQQSPCPRRVKAISEYGREGRHRILVEAPLVFRVPSFLSPSFPGDAPHPQPLAPPFSLSGNLVSAFICAKY